MIRPAVFISSVLVGALVVSCTAPNRTVGVTRPGTAPRDGNARAVGNTRHEVEQAFALEQAFADSKIRVVNIRWVDTDTFVELESEDTAVWREGWILAVGRTGDFPYARLRILEVQGNRCTALVLQLALAPHRRDDGATWET